MSREESRPSGSDSPTEAGPSSGEQARGCFPTGACCAPVEERRPGCDGSQTEAGKSPSAGPRAGPRARPRSEGSAGESRADGGLVRTPGTGIGSAPGTGHWGGEVWCVSPIPSGLSQAAAGPGLELGQVVHAGQGHPGHPEWDQGL